MFHLELRQFPHVARAFNLTREELDRRFAQPWVTGTEIEHEDRNWAPGKAKLTIMEGPELGLEELGLGRGWATVGKTSQEVTETVLAQAERRSEGRTTVEMVKAAIRGAARSPLGLDGVLALVAAEYPAWRPSEQLATAEQAVWELLHQGRLALRGPGGPIETEAWSEILLSWESWTSGAPDLVLEASDLGQTTRPEPS
ncbi:MAG: hypothetical protein ABI323_03825 [Solirubrobacteraceae bacterium]